MTAVTPLTAAARDSAGRAAAIAHAAASESVGKLLAVERSRAEWILAWVRLVVLGLLCAAALAYAPALTVALQIANAAVLLPALTWAIVEIVIVRRRGGIYPPGVAARVFERFFTTKPDGKGTGLGLWMVATIVSVHGGQIVAENGERGARFIITLPVLREVAAA